MKNLYFGEIIDYYKYGLLRYLSRDTDIKTSVCWMLTKPDDKAHGIDVGFLLDKGKYRIYDPELFDFLCSVVPVESKKQIKKEKDKIKRLEKIEKLIETCNVDIIEKSIMLKNTNFNSRDLDYSDGDWFYLEGRNRIASGRYFQQFTDISKNRDLVFFDPDNGLEADSMDDYSKYLFFDEIPKYYQNSSLLIFQYSKFDLLKEGFTQSINSLYNHRPDLYGHIMKKLSKLKQTCEKLYLFKTHNVLFILMTKPPHNGILDARAQEFKESDWHKNELIVMEVF